MSESDVNGEPMPILFLLGPSGSGKTTLAAWARDDLGFLHLEIDRFREGDGIDLERLRAEWDAYWKGADARPLAAVLKARGLAARERGVILSFPSGVVPSSQQMTAAAQADIRVLVLYGTGAECLDAFLQRERSSGRGLDTDHWIHHNARAYAAFSCPRLAAHRVLAFSAGRFRTRSELVAEVRERAG